MISNSIFLSGLPDQLSTKPAYIHNPELSDKIDKSAYRPINLSLIGINPDGARNPTRSAVPDYLLKLNHTVKISKNICFIGVSPEPTRKSTRSELIHFVSNAESGLKCTLFLMLNQG